MKPLAFAICLGLLAACSPAAPQLPLEGFCGAVARADCERRQACGETSAQVDCARLDHAVLADCATRERHMLDAGLVRYDPAAAAACVRELSAEPCTARWSGGPPPPLCPDAFVGPAGQGEPCGYCAAGLDCTTVGSLCGTCVPRSTSRLPPGRSIGARCENPALVGDLCEAAGYCASVDGGAWQCLSRLGPGDSCVDPICRRDLACLPSASDGGACQPRLDVGAACDGDICLGGLRCVAGVCRAIAYSGEACVDSFQCAYGFELPCVGGVCASPVALGGSCAQVACVAEAYCGADGGCVRRLELGQGPCNGFDCAQGAVCVSGDGGSHCVGPFRAQCGP